MKEAIITVKEKVKLFSITLPYGCWFLETKMLRSEVLSIKTPDAIKSYITTSEIMQNVKDNLISNGVEAISYSSNNDCIVKTNNLIIEVNEELSDYSQTTWDFSLITETTKRFTSRMQAGMFIRKYFNS